MQDEQEDRDWLQGIVPRQHATNRSGQGTQAPVDDNDGNQGGGGGGGAAAAAPPATPGGLGMLARHAKTAPPDQRTFRLSLIQEKWPLLYQAWLEVRAHAPWPGLRALGSRGP